MTNSGNTNNNEDTLLNEVHKKVSVLQELYIELFATLMLGFVMTLSTLILLFLFHYFTFDQLLFTTVLSEHLNPWLGFVSILVISYTFGAILYRKDLKKLDRISSYIQWRTSTIREKKRLAVQYPFLNCEKKCVFCTLTHHKPHEIKKSELFSYSFFHIPLKKLSKISRSCIIDNLIFYIAPGCLAKQYSVEGYPYQYLRQYLFKRGLYHLLIFIPWCPNVKQDTSARSKMVINELKTVIKSGKNGHYMLDLLRNEGHIRMLTSMWYVMKYLMRTTILLFILGVTIKTCSADNKIVANITNFLKFETIGSSSEMFFAENVSVNPPLPSTMRTNGSGVDNASLKPPMPHPHTYCAFLAAGLLVFWFCWGKRSIEKSIHYVRIREIVMVLEQAYHIRISSPNSPFWNVIDLRNRDFLRNKNKLKKKCSISCTGCCCQKSAEIWGSPWKKKKILHRKSSTDSPSRVTNTVNVILGK